MKQIFIYFMILLCLSANAKNIKNVGDSIDDTEIQHEFFDDKIMTHAMGEYEGNIYNNHELALQQSIQNGSKLIELDLILTSDNKLVCSHGWSEQTYKDTGVKYDAENPIMDYETFMSTKIQGKYSTMDAKRWSEYVIEYEDILWEIDLRTITYDEAYLTARKIVRLFKNHKDCLDRLLIQVGSKDMYNAIDSVYKFNNYQYFIHKNELENLNEIIDFCLQNDFISIAVNYKYMSKELSKEILDSGLKILCYTVDEKDLADCMFDLGANTICSNFLQEEDFQ